jgi:methylisocitrate lyase
MANNVEGGKTPLLPAKQLEAIGYGLVAFPTSGVYAVSAALVGVMNEIFEKGTSEGFCEHMMVFEAFNEEIVLLLVF